MTFDPQLEQGAGGGSAAEPVAPQPPAQETTSAPPGGQPHYVTQQAQWTGTTWAWQHPSDVVAQAMVDPPASDGWVPPDQMLSQITQFEYPQPPPPIVPAYAAPIEGSPEQQVYDSGAVGMPFNWPAYLARIAAQQAPAAPGAEMPDPGLAYGGRVHDPRLTEDRGPGLPANIVDFFDTATKQFMGGAPRFAADRIGEALEGSAGFAKGGLGQAQALGDRRVMGRFDDLVGQISRLTGRPTTDLAVQLAAGQQLWEEQSKGTEADIGGNRVNIAKGAAELFADPLNALDPFNFAPAAGAGAALLRNVGKTAAKVPPELVSRMAAERARGTTVTQIAESFQKELAPIIASEGDSSTLTNRRQLVASVLAGEKPQPARGVVPAGQPTRLEGTVVPKPGNTAVAFTPRGRQVATQFEAVEAEDLVTSHRTDLSSEPRFPAELQPRDRTRAASEDQISRIVASLQPERLAESPSAGEGAPIIGRGDNVVESGNARAIALRRAYEQNHPSGQSYKQWLLSNADRFGLDANAIRAMKRPVLVRRNVEEMTPEQRLEFVREANEPAVATMSASETARADAGRLTDEMLDIFNVDEGGDILGANNREFVRSFIAGLSDAERGALVTAEGALSQSGAGRIRNAIFQRAYGDASAVERLSEATDTNVRNILNGMLVAAPKVAKMRAAMSQGNLYGGLDIAPDIAAAMKKLSALRDDGTPVDVFLAQQPLLGRELSPVAEDLLAFFNANMRSSRKIADFLERYADSVVNAGDPKQTSLFGPAAPPDLVSVLNAAATPSMSQEQLLVDAVARQGPTFERTAEAAAQGVELTTRGPAPSSRLAAALETGQDVSRATPAERAQEAAGKPSAATERTVETLKGAAATRSAERQAILDAATKKAREQASQRPSGAVTKSPKGLIPDTLGPQLEKRMASEQLPREGVPGSVQKFDRGEGKFIFVSYGPDGKANGLLITGTGRPNVIAVAPGSRRQGVATKLYDTATESGIDVMANIGRGGRTTEGIAFTEAYRKRRTLDRPTTLTAAQRAEAAAPIPPETMGAGAPPQEPPKPPTAEAAPLLPDEGPSVNVAKGVGPNKEDIDVGKLLADLERPLDKTRGRRTHEMTTAAATKLLAAKKISADTLVSVKTGDAVNAEMLVAYDKVVTDLVTKVDELASADVPGEDLLDSIITAAEGRRKLRGLAEEPGRATEIQKITPIVAPETQIGQTAAGRIASMLGLIDDPDVAKIIGDALKDALRGLTPEERLEGLRNITRVIADEIDEQAAAKELVKLEGERVPRAAKVGTARQVIRELVRANLLSGLAVGTNLIGNTAKVPLVVGRIAAAAGAESVRAGAGKLVGKNVERNVYWSELKATRQMLDGLAIGARAGWDIAVHGKQVSNRFADFEKEVLPELLGRVAGKAGERLGGAALWGSRLSIGTDQMYREMYRGLEVSRAAHREAAQKGLDGAAYNALVAKRIAAPKLRTLVRAHKYADKETWNNAPGRVSQWLLDARDIPVFGDAMFMLMPFISTHANILDEGLNWTPLGFGRTAREWRDLAPAARVERLSQAAAGTASLVALGATIIGTDSITGSGPLDYYERLEWEKDHQRYSVKVGDTWVDYTFLGPFATPIMLMADYADAAKYDGEVPDERTIGGSVAHMAKAVWNQAGYMDNLYDLMKGVQDGDEAAIARFLANSARSLTPQSGGATVARNITEPYAQQYDRDLPMLEQVGERYAGFFPRESGIARFSSPRVGTYERPRTGAAAAFPIRTQSAKGATRTGSGPMFFGRGAGGEVRSGLPAAPAPAGSAVPATATPGRGAGRYVPADKR